MRLYERMSMLLEMRKEHLQTMRANAADLAKDRNGASSSSVKGTLRFIGVTEFVLTRNVAAFRQNLAEAAGIRVRLFERHGRGEPIDKSYVAMISYQELFDSLAASDFETAVRLAELMGGRPELEAKYDHPFDRCLGYTLKAFVLADHGQMVDWASRFSAMCQSGRKRDFIGYSQVFDGIMSDDRSMANEGLFGIVSGHKNQTKRGGVFEGREDETLCVWGIGIANLARRNGLSVDAVPPLVPSELLL
jgi:hypothetical protein